MRDGIIIQEQACPRCAIRRTARQAYGASFCFNCRLQWPTHAAPLPHTAEVPSQHFVFARDELARLSVYRTAVRDGFYTEPRLERPRTARVVWRWRDDSRGGRASSLSKGQPKEVRP